MTASHTIGRRIVASVLALTVVGSIFYAPFLGERSVRHAQAVGATVTIEAPGPLLAAVAGTLAVETSGLTIQQVLNGVAWAVAKQAIRTMTRSVVNWINSGFEGSPAFATDLNRMLRQMGDAVATNFVTELVNNTSINSPYLERALSTVATGYLLYTSRDAIVSQLRYTLSEYSQNEEAFRRGQFNQGGFNAWFAATRDCGNDPFCVETSTRDELMRRINADTRGRLEELGWGRGFLAWRNCPDAPQAEGADSGGTLTSLSDADSSIDCPISTPGSVIENALIQNLDSPLRELQLADSINEIVGALASQLVSQVLGGTGLLGTSQPSTGGGRSYLEQVAGQGTPATLVDGFEQTVRAEQSRITTNQALWQTFRATAARAVSACTSGVGNPQKTTNATTALTQADAMLARATRSLTTLNGIITDLGRLNTLTGSARSALIQQMTTAYNGVLTSGGVDAPTSTLTELITDIADNGCE